MADELPRNKRNLSSIIVTAILNFCRELVELQGHDGTLLRLLFLFLLLIVLPDSERGVSKHFHLLPLLQSGTQEPDTNIDIMKLLGVH